MINKQQVLQDNLTMCTHDIAIKHGVSQRAIQLILKEHGVVNKFRKQKITKATLLDVGYVYEIRISDRFVYIGETTDLGQRMNVHLSELRRGVHACRMLQYLYDTSKDDVFYALMNPVIINTLNNTNKAEMTIHERNLIVEKEAIDGSVINSPFGDVKLYKMGITKY